MPKRRRCSSCKKLKTLAEYYKRSNSPHPLTICKTCRSIRSRSRTKEEADRLLLNRKKRDRVSVLLQNAKSRAKIHGAVFSLSPGEIERLRRVWEIGVCELTGVAFDRDGVGGPLVPSLDRKDSAYGYLDGNVRLVVWAANRMMAGWGEDSVAPVILGWANKLREGL